MVKYVSQYSVLVEGIQTSAEYKNSVAEVKKQVDEWLAREDFRNYFSGRLALQLSLQESLFLGIMNSDAIQQRTPREREKVIAYLDSESFKRSADSLERMLDGRMTPV